MLLLEVFREMDFPSVVISNLDVKFCEVDDTEAVVLAGAVLAAKPDFWDALLTKWDVAARCLPISDVWCKGKDWLTLKFACCKFIGAVWFGWIWLVGWVFNWIWWDFSSSSILKACSVELDQLWSGVSSKFWFCVGKEQVKMLGTVGWLADAWFSLSCSDLLDKKGKKEFKRNDPRYQFAASEKDLQHASLRYYFIFFPNYLINKSWRKKIKPETCLRDIRVIHIFLIWPQIYEIVSKIWITT